MGGKSFFALPASSAWDDGHAFTTFIPSDHVFRLRCPRYNHPRMSVNKQTPLVCNVFPADFTGPGTSAKCYGGEVGPSTDRVADIYKLCALINRRRRLLPSSQSRVNPVWITRGFLPSSSSVFTKMSELLNRTLCVLPKTMFFFGVDPAISEDPAPRFLVF